MGLKYRNIQYVLWMSYFCGVAGQLDVSSDECATIGDRFRIQLVISNTLFIAWRRSDKTTDILSIPRGNQCGVEPNSGYVLTRYTFTCDSNSYTMDINNIANDDLNLSWTVEVDGTQILTTQQVRLCVPVKAVNLTQPIGDRIDVNDSVSETFKCVTSASWPQSNVTWYRQRLNNANEDVIANNVTTTFTTTSENLIITKSSLYYNVTRGDQNSTIYCKAKQNVGTSVTSTNQPQINVLYVPDDIFPVIKGYSDSYSLVENSTLNLTCVINGGNPRPILTWICNGGTVTDENNGVETTVRVVWTAERNKDGACTCISYHPLVSTNQSDTVNIEILYPPTKPAISIGGINRTGTVTVIKNTYITVRCLSSSKPTPDYTWLVQNNQYSGETISVPINQNTSVRCAASNTMRAESGISMSDIFFHMLYGPITPKLSCSSYNSQSDINGPTVDVIDGDTPTLTCLADGDPEPTYTWNGQDGGNVTISNIAQDTMVYNCTASSFLKPNFGNDNRLNSSSYVQINKLYGPQTPPELTYTYESGASGNLSTPFNVVENSSFSIICDNSNSRPLSKYTWIGQIESDSGVLDVTAIRRSPNVDIDGSSFYECTCLVRNTMVNTCGVQRTETGTRNRTQRVNVLFSAALYSAPDQNVLEGNTFNLSAAVRYHGSPRETYTWFYNKTESSSKTELATNLTHTIKNISRLSAGFYTIQATNQISPTGLETYTSIVSQTFNLNVFYTTSISTFKLDGQYGNVTVNESTPVALLCNVDSNPGSNIHLHANTYNGENSLAQSTLAYTLKYMLQTATCYDTGVYVCNGKNNYTSIQAVERSYLFVRCTPRPRYPVSKNITIYSSLGESVTLNMTVIAYPIPSPGQFAWVKINGQNETVITSEPNTNITTADLDTQLAIKQLNQTDLGQYKLTIQYSDTGDSYIHYFYIAPKVKDVLTSSDSSSAAIGGVVGSVSALIIIVVVVVVFICRRKGGNDSEEHGYETPQSRTMSSENDDAYNTLHTDGQVYSDSNTYYNLDRNPYEDLKRDNEDNHEYGTLNISDDTEINGKRSDDKLYENLRLSPMKLE